jgi:hypothetical protein
MRDTFRELRQHFDGQDPFMTKGHQILIIRRIKRKPQPWAKDNKKVQQLLLRSFPKINIDLTTLEQNNKNKNEAELSRLRTLIVKQRAQAGRWARIIQLYFVIGMTYGQVAKELNLPPRKVEYYIQTLLRVSKNRRADGHGMLNARPRGRPKKPLTSQRES